MSRVRYELDVPRFEQPDDVSCGPTCLLQVLRYYGDERTMEEVVAATDRNPDGGTLAVFLGIAAIRLGYRARILPYNLRVFDPTWFDLPMPKLRAKLEKRREIMRTGKMRKAITAYLNFIDRGGEIQFEELTSKMLRRIIDRGHPILVGLSSTYLYRHPRELPDTMADDDINGEPTGHFVVMCGYRGRGRHFVIRDPASHVPFSITGRYSMPCQRLINSILLGDVSYDAVLLELWPSKGGSS